MRDVDISSLALPSGAFYYECDRYGNAITNTTKSITTDKISLNTTKIYQIEYTINKQTTKIKLYPFEGEGEFYFYDIVSPIYLHKLEKYFFYSRNIKDSLVVDMDFFRGLNDWLSGVDNYFPEEHRGAFMVFVNYADMNYANNNTTNSGYFQNRFLSEINKKLGEII